MIPFIQYIIVPLSAGLGAFLSTLWSLPAPRRTFKKYAAAIGFGIALGFALLLISEYFLSQYCKCAQK